MLFFCLFVLSFLIYSVVGLTKSPIVVVPGLGGSALEAKINLTHIQEHNPDSEISKFCKDEFKDWNWFWVSLWDDSHLECMKYILTLQWDNEKKITKNSPGVEIRGIDFGGVGGIRWLDNSIMLRYVSRYFEDTISYLKDNFGYEFGDTIRGVPFDFRLSPQELMNKNQKNENIGFMSTLKTMIEEMYEKNSTKVSIVGHSQGVAVSSLFLSTFVTKEWKEKYIHAFISISGVWDGANEGYGYPFVGYQLDLPTFLDGPWKIIDKFESVLFQDVFLNWPGVQWMLPKDVSQDEVVLVSGKNKEIEITGKEYYSFLSNYGHQEIASIYDFVSQQRINLPPEVPLHCLYTYDMKTPLQFYIDNLTHPTYGLVSKWGDGDGQVQVSNHLLCDEMVNRQSEPVNVYRTTKIGHNFLPRDKRVIDYVASVVVWE